MLALIRKQNINGEPGPEGALTPASTKYGLESNGDETTDSVMTLSSTGSEVDLMASESVPFTIPASSNVMSYACSIGRPGVDAMTHTAACPNTSTPPTHA